MTVPRLVMRASAVLILIVGIVLAIVAGVTLAYQAARLTSRIGVLLTTLLVVFFITTTFVLKVAARLWELPSRRLPLRASAVLTLLLALTVALTVVRPLHTPHRVPVARAGTQFWNLPSGSRIAYSVYRPPVGVVAKPHPIIFLHGGPGLRANDYDHAFYSQFAQDGFNVYIFDQAGSGLSQRLPHAADYTVQRFVSDLEQIRAQIGAQQIILIGHSWGGMLAAYYAAAHPDHVDRLVFHSPGPIAIEALVPFELDRTAVANPHATLPPPRVLAALALSNVNITASEHLMSQSELGDWQLNSLDPGQLVCKGEANKLPPDFSPATMAGTNLYPILVTNHQLAQKAMDVRPQLSGVHVPAIALYSQCDMIPWSNHAQYKHSIPGLQEFYFADAGHYINLSQPQKLAALLRSFLLDQPPPFPAYQGDTDPRPPRPASRPSNND